MTAPRPRIVGNLFFSLLTIVALGACPETPPVGGDGGSNSRVDAHAVIVDAAGDASSTTTDATGTDSADAGQVADATVGVDRRIDNSDPFDPNNADKDSDCDGLSDQEEYANVYADGAQTSPDNWDSDGDGLADGLELGRTTSPDSRCANIFVGDADPSSTTNPTLADSDRDGLSDGSEDSNADGAWDEGLELDPNHPDTDRDGLCDGNVDVQPICTAGDNDPLSADLAHDQDADGVLDDVDSAPNNPDRDGDGLCDGNRSVAGVCVAGEDLNGDGVVNAGETDPDLVDTDCDGLSDLEERNLGLDPTDPDSDGDMINDGVELGRTRNIDPDHCANFIADTDPSSTTDPGKIDSDGDGLNDGVEDSDHDGRFDTGETDASNPDTDGDGLCDGPRTVLGSCIAGEDTNANGIFDFGETDPRVSDSADGGGGGDVNPNDPNNANKDSDCDGISDAEEYAFIYAGGGQTDPANPDSDGDGLPDGLEIGRTDSTDQNCNFVGDSDTTTHTDPTNQDTDDDGVLDGDEDVDHDGAWDQGQELNPRDPDTDNDGLCDGANDVLPICIGGDPSPLLANGQDADGDGILDADDPAPDNPDRDGDGLCDGSIPVVGQCLAGEDLNRDGVLNAGETDPEHVDTDCDGVSDGEERSLGLNPRKADSDGDLIPDGVELGRAQNLDPAYCPDFVADADPSTQTNPLSLDSDDDGLSDGLEDSDHNGQFDSGETDPSNPDTDGDDLCDGPPHAFAGVCTGGEDLNANGVVDRGETDPRVAEGAQVDAGSQDVDPLDPMNGSNDSDCDGLSDAIEFATVYPSGGQTDPNNPDTDGDGILDGVELGVTSSPDVRCQGFVGDLDSASHSDPLDADTDNDGLDDGQEDSNHNGRVDSGETKPRDPDSDDDGLCDGPLDVSPICTGGDPDPLVPEAPADSDGDGLLDSIENMVPGLDANNPDSDGDGLNDGVEDRNHDGVVNAGETDPKTVDTDCDGVSDSEELNLGLDPLKQDSDGDLISDGVELGRTTNLDSSHCASFVGDADDSTTTSASSRDSDGDGLSDGVEDRNHNGRVDAGETDPSDADSDNDGLSDGDEDSNHNGQLDYGETDPLYPNVDSDGDGLEDGVEDANQDGSVDSGETDPHNPDSDNDGLNDGDELFNQLTDPLSPDSDCDGVSDGDEVNMGLDPLNPDSDMDGLLDGVELGYTTNLDPALCLVFVADADPSSTTDPLDADSDNDGVVDGAEDGNQNGRVDAGELDPNDGGDVSTTIDAACAHPRQPNLFSHALSDILLASAPEFAVPNTSIITATDGSEVGRTVVDDANSLVGFAVHVAPVSDPVNQLIAIESRISSGVGNVTIAVNQSFSSWDGYSAARATANVDNSDNAATATLKLVRQILQDSGATVPVLNAPSENGPYKIGLEVVHRSASTAIVLGVITRLEHYENASLGRDFRLEDFYAGTSLAQVGDTTGQQCDIFQTEKDQPVDIIWVVDDSGSMSDAQNAVTSARTEMTNILDNSPLDWRIAVVTTYYWTRQDGTGSDRTYCDFMTTSSAFGTCMDHIQASGRGDERGHQSLQRILNGRWLPAAADQANKIRPDALVMVIFLSDAGDQSCNADGTGCTTDRPATNDIAGWTAFAQGGVHTDTGGTDVSWDPNRTDEPAMIYGGILCPIPDPTGGCSGETDWDSYHSRVTYHDVINNINGVIGALATTSGGTLSDPDSEIAGVIPPMLNNLIFSASVYELLKSPISATIKVAVDSAAYGGSVPSGCNNGNASDIPRSQDDGFGYDAATNRIAFFGDCRPTVVGEDIAASYYYWNDLTADPDGADQPPVCVDPLVWNGEACVCPADCGVGAIPASQVCNTDPAVCAVECRPDCGGSCSGASVCNNDDSVCACECPSDCGGTAPSAAFVCDRDSASASYCTWVCPANCGAAAPDPDMVCDAESCAWTCPVDSCAGGCPGLAVCSDSTCDCQCEQSLTCDAGWMWSDSACDCVCDTSALNCGANFVANTATCACDCGPDCNGNCPGGADCIPSLCACECPVDCGVAQMPVGFTCNTVSCELECQDDCGQSCAGASTCNNDDSVCACECPADCGGLSPGAGFVCDRDPASATFCSYVCDQCPGSPASAAQTCDTSTCTWQCPDCGDCPGLSSCSDSTCACECQVQLSCNPGFTWDQQACDCVCDTGSLGCGGNYVADAELCACVCPESCGGNCGSGTLCNDSTCACECAPDCGLPNMPPEQTCDTSTCTAVCRADCGGTCTGASVCNSDDSVCACECPADCGGLPPSAGFVCDRDPASASFCSYVCDTCPGEPSQEGMVCDLTTCNWTCAAHDACTGFASFDDATCTCTCPADLSCAPGYIADNETCDCVCDTASLGCDAKYDVDSQACACVCGDNCNDQCDGGTYCNQSLCACLPAGG